MPTLTYRNRQGEVVSLLTVAASRYKNESGAAFEKATLGGAVAITKHDAPKAVLIAYAEFEALMRARSSGVASVHARRMSSLSRSPLRTAWRIRISR